MKNITKTFGPVIANDKVNLDIYKGEILSLLGENGSGKTTLMNMLSGIYFPDEGQIFINGREVVIKSPKDALKLGIGMVHQHFKLIDVLSATENIILGLPGKLNIKEASKKIEDICNKYGVDLISLIAPTSENRVAMIAREAEGFIYIVSSLGVTGVRSEIRTDISSLVKLVRENSSVPCAVGFGISTPEQAAKMADISDGAIVGSAIVKLIAQYGKEAAGPVGEYVKSMTDAVHAL